MSEKFDILNQELKEGDYVFTDCLNLDNFDVQLQIFVVTKLTKKNVKLKKLNKPKSKEIYRSPKSVIKFNPDEHPELFI